MVSINVGGTQSTMSMEISKPTMLQGDIARQRLEDNVLFQLENRLKNPSKEPKDVS